MITHDELTEIGAFYKPHGIKGEISAGFDYDIDPDSLRCIVLDMDGIPVPFFIESWRSRGLERFLIKLEGIDDERAAQSISNKPFYGLTAELDIEPDNPEDGMYLLDMIGFTLFDGDKSVGIIENIDDSTDNILLHVADEGGHTVYIPFAEDWIESFDPDKKTLNMNLPDGIIDLNN